MPFVQSVLGRAFPTIRRHPTYWLVPMECPTFDLAQARRCCNSGHVPVAEFPDSIFIDVLRCVARGSGMRCEKCGKENPGYSIFCGWCGGDLPELPLTAADAHAEPAAPVAASTPEPSSQWADSLMRYCSRCGKKIRADSFTCQYCGERPWDPPGSISGRYDTASDDSWRQEISVPQQTGFPVIGGIMAILAGILAVGQGLLYIAGAAVISIGGSGLICACGAIDFLFGALSVMGGIAALKREHFAMAIIGAVLGMLGLGFLIGFLLGLLAVIFIAVSQKEFA